MTAVPPGPVPHVHATRDAYVAQSQYFGTSEYTIGRFEVPPRRAPEEWRDVAPSELLATRNAVVPFTGRGAELDELAVWRDNAEHRAARLMYATGGQGKTRLAARFAELSAHQGWAVLIARHREGTWQAAHAGPDGRGRLLVVDYAERWPVTVLDRLLRAEPLLAGDGPVRVLLLARTDGGWWDVLRHPLRESGYALSQHKLTSLADHVSQREAVFAQAAGVFSAIYGTPGVPLEPAGSLAAPDYGVVLTVHMAALATVHADAHKHRPPADPGELSQYLLDREYAHWGRMREAGKITTDPDTMARLATTATLAGPLPHATATALLTTLGLADSPATALTLLDDHARCYPRSTPATALEPLYPDRLGEDLVADRLPGAATDDRGREGDGWCADLPERLLAHAVPAHRRRTWTVLVETGRRWPHVREKHLYRLLRGHPGFTHEAGSASVSALVGYAPVDVLEGLEAGFPTDRHAGLDLPIALITQRLTEHRLATTSDPGRRAGLFSVLGERLARAGLVGPALDNSRRALAESRLLFERDPGHAPALGSVLINHGTHLTRNGLAAEALAATQEAVGIYRILARASPAAYERGLALATNNLSVDLGHAGRFTEALAAAEQAVDIYRRLTKDTSRTHEPNLALALFNVGTHLSSLGRLEEALPILDQVAGIHRALVDGGTSGFEPELARSLDTLIVVQRGLGLIDEALTTSEHAVAIRQRLAELNPIAHERGLTRLLEFVGVTLAEQGRHTEAVTLLHQAMRTAQPPEPKHLGHVGRSLVTASRSLTELGRDADALAASEQAVEILRHQEEQSPGSCRYELGVALGNLAYDLSAAGRPEAAARALNESLAIIERLASEYPGTYDADLGRLLHSRAMHLVREGNPEGALLSARRAIELLETHSADDPAHYQEPLGMALNGLGVILGMLGRREEALAASRRGIATYRAAAGGNLAAHSLRFAGVLREHAEGLAPSEGDLEEKRLAQTEAIEIYRKLIELSSPAAEELISLAYLELAATLDAMGRETEATEADRQAISTASKGPTTSDGSAASPLTQERRKGERYCDRGYRVASVGRTDDAIELLRLSVFHFRRAGDIGGEVIALENIYLALRDAQRYDEALHVLMELTDPVARTGVTDKITGYLTEVVQACECLEQFTDPPITIREAVQQADIERVAATYEAETIERRGFLIVTDRQDVLEVLANMPHEKRIRFATEFCSRLAPMVEKQPDG
ncbi:hypothetical protein GCM10009677_62620 [Sphaerisporangium rubeum]|uniref:Tetratricopeptide (TPR) repeat protein n=1 Tax=Sphaerisporangium rubeum TaxID=321317 RepID=A0A7X0IJ43_9ACTN|nr:tetratricopeptide repeat protein [Sphaerisporangium rubeum]MBB6476116.1 tetratricopeptide (TPR) repeat protein [Sphaerisporangium rubeum]